MTRKPKYMKTQCHYCETDMKNIDFITRCSNKRCQIIFCEDCIINKFDQNFEQENYKPEFWICYKCQNKCTCIQCFESQNQPKRKTRSKLSQGEENLSALDMKQPGYHKRYSKKQEKIQLQQAKTIDQQSTSGEDETQVTDRDTPMVNISSSLQIEETFENLDMKQKVLDELISESKTQKSDEQTEQTEEQNNKSQQENNDKLQQQQQQQSENNIKRKSDEQSNQNFRKCENKFLRRKLMFRKYQSNQIQQNQVQV